MTCSGFIDDAYAVHQTGLAKFLETRTNEKVIHFLKSYQDQRSSPQYPNFVENLSLNDVMPMVAFHKSIMVPLARHYTDWALDNLDNETKRLRRRDPMSGTEETRLMRALYRFQICCNLLGAHGDAPFWSDLKLHDTLNMFICLYEPWEVEEIGCVYAFAETKYNQIFTDIRWDVHEENPKFEGQRPPTPEGAFDLDNSCEFPFLPSPR